MHVRLLSTVSYYLLHFMDTLLKCVFNIFVIFLLDSVTPNALSTDSPTISIVFHI